jgi:hypothetical protein
VNLTALEDETTALYRDVGNHIPGDAESLPRRTDISFTPLRELQISHIVGLSTVWGMCNIQTWFKLMDPKEQVLFLSLDDEGRIQLLESCVCERQVRLEQRRGSSENNLVQKREH